MQIPEIPSQRKFVSSVRHAQSNAHKPPKTVAPTGQYLSIGPKKNLPRNAHNA